MKSSWTLASGLDGRQHAFHSFHVVISLSTAEGGSTITAAGTLRSRRLRRSPDRRGRGQAEVSQTLGCWIKKYSFSWPSRAMKGRHWSPFPLALSRTPAEAARPRVVCPFTPSFRWHSLTDPGGMARWVGVGTQQTRAGVEPATSRSQVRHSTTRPLGGCWGQGNNKTAGKLPGGTHYRGKYR